MKSLLDAIISRFTAASLPDTITGGIHLEEAPAWAAAPYTLMHVITSDVTQLYGTPYFGETQIDFVTRGVGASTTLALAESVRDAYKNQLLTISGGQMINTILAMDCIPEPSDPTTDEQGRDTFGWIVSFRFTVN